MSRASPSAAAGLAKALGDPLRLTILHRLMEGPAAVAELMATTGEPQSKVSNHLAVLRARGLVVAKPAGRQSIYELRNPTVALLVESLLSISGGSSPARGPSASLALARTCYDHLAGKLGVAVCDALVARGAIVRTDRVQGDFELGPAGPALFGRLGVEWQYPSGIRRRYAHACLDWTERRPHLGGWLGARLCERAIDAKWVTKVSGGRAVSLTPPGARVLKQCLRLSETQLASVTRRSNASRTVSVMAP